MIDKSSAYANHRVEALLMDYDAGHFSYQPISEVFSSHKQAKHEAFLSRFDFDTARVVKC